MSEPAIRAMSQAEFFEFAQARETRFEFDGSQPMAMTGGTLAHSVITGNILRALGNRLAGGGCRPLGPDAGVQTVGQAVRYPDVVVTCSKLSPDMRLVPSPLVIFEVLSPSSARTDRIVKLREYAEIATLKSYVLVEVSGTDLHVFERSSPQEQWKASVVSEGETLYLRCLDVAVPVEEIYAGLQGTLE